MSESNPMEPAESDIAVIGLSGRFPGARDVDTFWRNLREGVESISRFSPEELERAPELPEEPWRHPDFVPAGGVLEGIELFDHDFFELTPREAQWMDPQQRLFMQHAWAALESAGYDPSRFPGKISLYAGAGPSGYLEAVLSHAPQDPATLFEIMASASAESLATRTSYKLGLRGESLMVYTACSTGLVAVHMASQSLLLRQSDIALAGAARVFVPHRTGYLYQEGMILSPDGHCRAFDHKAQGTVGGNGVAVVVLKRLVDALRDGDPIHAVLKGSAINNDGGAKSGYTAPSVEGQAAVIEEAQAYAGVEPEDISYVEAHGTGTALGDPIEVAALTRAFGTDARRDTCALGSVKTNIGHLDTVAGLAGFIKVVLALEHEALPPSLNFERPNPELGLERGPFFVNTALRPWPRGARVRRAGVSSFGIGGTNAHAVLEEAPRVEGQSSTRPWQLVTLSARSASALDAMTRELAAYVETKPDVALADLAFTRGVGRKAFEHRRTLVVPDAAGLLTSLRQPPAPAVTSGAAVRRVAFLFPGQGSQSVGMGRELYGTEPEFRRHVEACLALLDEPTRAEVRALLLPRAGEEAAATRLLTESRCTLPALFIVEYALAQLWMAWGVRPYALLGHSHGEYVAACLAGVLSLEEGLRLAVARGQLMARLPPGAMLAVGLAPQEVSPLLTGGLCLAAINAPRRCVISGPVPEVERLAEELRGRDVGVLRLPSVHAFHSHAVEPLMPELARTVASLTRRAPDLRYVSCVSGTWTRPEEAVDPRYWAEQMRQPVRFAAGMDTLLREGCSLFIEVGPGQELTGLARDCFAGEREVFAVASLRRGGARGSEHQVLLQSLGEVWRRGVEVDWEAFYAHERRQRIPLPTYPFEPKRCWLEPRARPAVPVSTPVPAPAPAAVPPVPIASPPEAPALQRLPRGELEQRVAALWSERLGTEAFGREDDFLELGGNSLMAAQLLTRLRETFGVQLALSELFETFTVAGIAARLEARVGTASPQEGVGHPLALVPVPRTGSLPLSYTQERVWKLEQSHPGLSAYNIPMALRLEGALDVAALERSVREVVHRHEALRTTYTQVEGRPVQRISASVDVPWEVIELRGSRAEREAEVLRLARQDALRPFSLETGPVLRVGLVRLDEAEHVLLVSIHHVVSDTLSMLAFVREVGTLYEAFRAGRPSALPPLPLQYADFAVWQRRSLAEGRLVEQQTYWRKQLAGMPSRLELPTDRPRPSEPRLTSARHPVHFPPELAEALVAFCKREGVTSFMALLAAWQTLFSRYSGQEDIVVGTPIANRSRPELEPLIGYVAHAVALRTNLSGDPSFRELLARVREVALGAFAHPDVPYEQLAEELVPGRDIGRSRMLDTVLVLHSGGQEEALDLAGLRVSSLDLPEAPVQWGSTLSALSLVLGEERGRLSGALEYATELFDADRIERLLGHFQTLLTSAMADPEQRLSQLPLMTPREAQALASVSHAPPPVPTLHASLAARAARHPERIALSQGARHLTWRELRTRSLQLASELRALGVGPEVPVLVCLERSIAKVAALWGILEAGGAFMPVSPEALRKPERFTAVEGREPVLVTDRERMASAPASLRVLFMEDEAGTRPPTEKERERSEEGAETLACMAPAPGTQGGPPLMLTLGNIAWLFECLDARLRPVEGESWLAADEASVAQPELELLWALSRGLRGVLPPERLAARLMRLRKEGPRSRPLDFSLSFFANDEDTLRGPKYQLLLECTKFADAHGFAAVWTPERHFHPFGGLYPQPGVVSAALAAITRTLQIRAGSVVLPLHDPLEVAEQWSVVDNLSNGRVGISFASGWHAHDFVFAPDRYEDRKAIMLREIETVRALWRGERVRRKGGGGAQVEVGVRPRPVQPMLPIWLTAAANPETFRLAGEMGAGVLTNLMAHDLTSLRSKVALYREAWRRAGHGPGRGYVSLMLHTFVGTDADLVRRTVREPLMRYFRSSLDITATLLASQGLQRKLEELTPADLDALVEHGFERYAEAGGLIGTLESCEARLHQVRETDVDDVACLIDFGLDVETTLEGLRQLDGVKRRMTEALRVERSEVLVEVGMGVREVLALVEGDGGALVHGPAALARALAEPLDASKASPVRALLLEGGAPSDLEVSRDSLGRLEVFLREGSTEEGGWPVPRRLGEEPPGVTWRVLDARGQPVPVGVVGELAAGGPGVARGFWNASEEARARFVPDPFEPTARLYRTGLRARLLAQGKVERLSGKVTWSASRPVAAPAEARAPAPVATPTRETTSGPGAPPPLRRVPRDRPLPLSFAQQRMWYLDQLETHGIAYNNPAAMRLTGPLDLSALQAALDELERRHESLRTTFAFTAEGPMQHISPPRGLPLARVTLHAVSAEEREAELERVSAAEVRQPFDLSRGPLLRPVLIPVHEDDHLLLLTAHHAVSDGWSTSVLMEELTTLYAAFHEHQPSPLPELKFQYADYAVWQREWLEGPALQGLLAWWRQRLAGVTPLELPLSHPRPAVQSFEGARHELFLPKDLSEALLALGRRERATPFMTLMALYQTLLFRYSGQEDFVVGSPMAGRSRPELEGLIGIFVNTVAYRAEVGAERSFRELLGRVRQSALEAYAHQEAPFERVVEALRVPRDLSRTPIFQTMLLLHNTPVSDAGFAGLRLRGVEFFTGTAKLDLQLDILETPAGLRCTFEYATALFAPSMIERMASHLVRLAKAVVESPEVPLSRLSLLTDEERGRVLVEWNATETPFARDTCVHQLFEAQAARTPEAIAVVAGDARLTYGELDRRANQLAHHLRAQGVGPEVLVGICVERSLEMVVGVLGVIKAGGAYVPLDPSYPRERLKLILEDTRAPVLLTQGRLADGLFGPETRVIRLDADAARLAAESDEAPRVDVSVETVAYVIYTSGSTGRPKGIRIRHGGLTNFITWFTSAFPLGPEDRVLQLSSLSFDVSVPELWAPLVEGRQLVLAPPGAGRDVELLLGTLERHRVTMMLLVPSLLRALLEGEGLSRSSSLRWVMVVGELVTVQLARQFQAQQPSAAFINIYGPTEVTVLSSMSRYRGDEQGLSVPIGKPLANLRLYVLDTHLQPLPPGIPGELYVGGVGLARDYLNRPDLTAERFIPDPFGGVAGARLYRTGDQVRWLDDGQVEYLGRIDFQVKVRGHRIELGEVEATLRQHPGVKDTVVIAHEEREGGKRLVAYVVGRDGRELDVGSLRDFLKQRLPEFMVPSVFVGMEVLPSTPSGKVDRRSLPPPGEALLESGSEYVAPGNDVEQRLATLWAEVLGLKRIGIRDNFFQLGGDSIQGLSVVMRAHRLGLKFTTRHLFLHPTIAELAPMVTQIAELSGALASAAGEGREHYPATPLQEEMLHHSRRAPGSGTYCLQLRWSLEGPLDVSALRRAFEAVMARHEILRTAFIASSSGGLLQEVRTDSVLPWAEFDWRWRPEVEQRTHLEAWLREDRARGLEPERAPLMRVALLRMGDEAYQLIWTLHHALVDGWSLQPLLRELSSGYEALSMGEALPRWEPAPAFRDYVSWLERQEPTRSRDFWRGMLGDFTSPTPLPERETRGPDTGTQAELLERRSVLSEASTRALQEFASENHLTPSTVVQAAWAFVLGRGVEREDVVFGITCSGRPPELPGIENAVGLFLNVLPVRVRLPTGGPLMDWLREVHARQMELLAWQHTPLERVREWSGVPRERPLFESVFVYENIPIDASLGESGPVRIRAERGFDRFHVPLRALVHPGPELSLELHADPARFSSEVLERLVEQWRGVLETWARESGRALSGSD